MSIHWLDKYRWNWKIVAFLDPDYAQFLIKEPNESDGLNEYLMDMEADVEVVEANAYGGPDRLRTQGLSEEEIDIVQEFGTHNGDDDKQSANIQKLERGPYPEYNINPFYNAQDIMVCNRMGIKYQFKPKKFPIALPPPKRVLGEGSILNVSDVNVYWFGHEMTERGRQYPVIKVTKYKYSHTYPFIRLYKSKYRFCQIINSMHEERGKYRGLTFNYETGNAYIIRNVHNKKQSRYKTSLQGLLFNIGLMEMVIDSFTPPKLIYKFIETIFNKVKERYPELELKLPERDDDTKRFNFNTDKQSTQTKIENIMNNHLNELNEELKSITTFIIIFIQILVQAKTHQKFNINNYHILSTIQTTLSANVFRERYEFIKKQDTLTKDELFKLLNARRSVVRNRIMKQLKSGSHPNLPKTIFKAIYKDDYTNLFLKLLLELENMVGNSASIINRLIDLKYLYPKEYKHLYHLFSYVFDNKNGVHTKVRRRFINTTSDMFSDLLYNYRKYENDTESTRLLIYSYTKIVKKLIRASESPLFPTWHTWKDLYEMASQLGIRIRPNKFTCTGDVEALHDKFSKYFIRDNKALETYEGYFFVKFDSPEHSYRIDDKEFWFTQLLTVNELVREGREMHHCVGSYGKNCITGSSIIFSMNDGNRSYITIELMGLNPNYPLAQIYTLNDNVVKNKKVNKIIDQWHKECVDIHKSDTITYGEISNIRLKEINILKDIQKMEDICQTQKEIDMKLVQNRLQKLHDELSEIRKEIKRKSQLFNLKRKEVT